MRSEDNSIILFYATTKAQHHRRQKDSQLSNWCCWMQQGCTRCRLSDVSVLFAGRQKALSKFWVVQKTNLSNNQSSPVVWFSLLPLYHSILSLPFYCKTLWKFEGNTTGCDTVVHWSSLDMGVVQEQTKLKSACQSCKKSIAMLFPSSECEWLFFGVLELQFYKTHLQVLKK